MLRVAWRVHCNVNKELSYRLRALHLQVIQGQRNYYKTTALIPLTITVTYVLPRTVSTLSCSRLLVILGLWAFDGGVYTSLQLNISPSYGAKSISISRTV